MKYLKFQIAISRKLYAILGIDFLAAMFIKI